MNTQDKMNKMWDAVRTIKRLLPEVEAELSLMGGVGAAPGKKTADARKKQDMAAMLAKLGRKAKNTPYDTI